MSINDSRPTDLLDRTRHEWAPRGRAEIVDILIGDPAPEASAHLAVMAEFLGAEDELTPRIKAELERRSPLRPKWLSRMSQTRIHRAVRVSHVLDGSDLILLQGRVPAANGDFTCGVELVVDELDMVCNGGVLNRSVEETVGLLGWAPTDYRCQEITLADAHARLTKAISWEDHLPPRESETWPINRALVEWLIRGLPEGGSAEPRPELDEIEVDELAARFLASPEGALFGRAHRTLLVSLIECGSEYGARDPMRWNESRAAGWLFGSLLEDDDLWLFDSRESAPILLRAFIRFAHDDVGIRPALTDEVVGAIEHWERDFQEKLRRKLTDGDDWYDIAAGDG
jgi:hypothetical protein